MSPESYIQPDQEPLQLHECSAIPSCGSELVQIDCEPMGFGDFSVQRWCPNCEWSGQTVCDEAALDRFEEAENEAFKAVIRSRDIWSYASMEAYVEVFAGALRAGAILPEDFCG